MAIVRCGPGLMPGPLGGCFPAGSPRLNLPSGVSVGGASGQPPVASFLGLPSIGDIIGTVGDFLPGPIGPILGGIGGIFGGGGNGAAGFGPCTPGFDCPGDIVNGGIPGGGIFDPTPGVGTPAEVGVGVATGPVSPSRVPRNVHVCPDFADGKMGILYFNAITNAIVCLPRGTTKATADGFGLRRKNKPRAKAAVTAHDMKLLGKISSIQSTISRASAKADGLSCPPKKKR